jgi:hypothetical protein
MPQVRSSGDGMARRMAKSGKPYERLVAALERVLAATGVTIEAPAHLVDRITGELREHDVLLTLASGHHTTRIGIECRDRSRKITVNDVEGFAAKCDHTGVDKAVMVSPKGFSKSALRKAEFLGVKCLMLSDAASFPWLGTDRLEGMHLNIFAIGASCVGDGELAAARNGPLTIRAADGRVLTSLQLTAIVRKAFNQIPREHFSVSGAGELGMFLPTKNAAVEDCAGNSVPLVGLQCNVKFEVSFEDTPIRRVEYVQADGTGQIARAAFAQIDMGGVRGKLMIVEKESGNEVSFVPEVGQSKK